MFLRQVYVLTIANLKSRYRKTLAGFVWVVLNPIIMYGVQSLVFKRFLKLDVPNYSLFLLSGLLPWIFISQALEMSTSTLVNSAQLLKSFPVHPLVYLGAQLLDNTLNFLAAFTLLLLPVVFGSESRSLALLLMPVPLVILTAAVLGMAWLLAITHVFFRDTRFLVTFAMSLFFFLTPVFYPIEFVPVTYRWLIGMNPVYRLIDPFRSLLYNFNALSFLHSSAIAAAIAAFFLGAAWATWKVKRNAIYITI